MLPQQQDLVWAASASEADAMIASDPGFALSSTLDFADSSGCAAMLGRNISEFLETNMRGGYALVKTSTTGNRSQSHEVSSSLLSFVLTLVADRVGSANVILADGPAYAESYLDECRRFGWDKIASNVGARIVDLNQDESVEVLPGWPISQTFMSADVVINICKAKTHRRFGVSLGTKSLLGVLSAKVLGYPKLVGRHNHVPWLLSKLVEISPPATTIIDGHEGIEGEGPLNGRSTKSHFLSMGVGYYGADIRAAIEMGFDPVLIPGFIRPGQTSSNTKPISWKGIRRTDIDFLPSGSCSWLYRSIHNSRSREKKYQLLLLGAKECWPKIR
jgi:hypothetical protein